MVHHTQETQDAKKKLGQIIAQLDVMDVIISDFSAIHPA